MAGEAERLEWVEPAEVAAVDPGDEAWTDVAPPQPPRWPARLLIGAMLALSTVWIAVLGWAITNAAPGSMTPLRLAAWVGVGSGPLTLLAALAILALRTGAVEANAFARRARILRREADRLTALMGVVNRRIDAAGRSLTEQGDAFATVGHAAGLRLGEAGAALRGETEAFARTAAALDDATAAARTDLGVLLADLPDAERRAEALSLQLRGFGQSAASHAEALVDRLGQIEAQARAADQGTITSARRLAVELERIEASAAAADRRLGEAAGLLGGASDAALAGAASALDEIRRGLSDQSAALTAMVAQARAGFGQSADDAARGLARQVDAVDQRLDGMSAGLREQEKAARSLLGQLEIAIGALEERFAKLGVSGAEQTADLAEAIVRLSGHAEQVGRTLGQGVQVVEGLVARAESLRTAVDASSGQVGEIIPTALARLRLHAEQSLQAIGTAGMRAEKLVGDAEAFNARLVEGQKLIVAQEQAIDRLDSGSGATLDALSSRLAAIAEAARRSESELNSLTEGATPALAAALERVQAAAHEAATLARAALTQVIPDAADTLAATAAREVTQAIAGVGRTELAQVGLVSAQAVDAARGASERLTRQLLVIAETTQALEQRIAEQGRAIEAADEASFARQAGLLIEALNSTAIDVAKLFSNEPTDIAWAAYLKGDRGVFTRRAVRLLDHGEARVIGERYAQDPEFHEQVNRYVHDFESLLRRLLSIREGDAMSVTLLSSDMGKLYVALAQAIERLRR